MDGTKAAARCRHRPPDPFDVGNVRRNNQHLCAFRLERPNLLNALADRMLRTLTPQPCPPFSALGKRGARKQDQFRLRCGRQMVGDDQAQPAKSTGNQVNTLVANPRGNRPAGLGKAALECLYQPLAITMRDDSVLGSGHQLRLEIVEQ